MADHEHREQVTLLLVNDALEANDRNVAEAVTHLVDAAGTLILHKLNGDRAVEIARLFAQYLIDQIEENAGGGRPHV